MFWKLRYRILIARSEHSERVAMRAKEREDEEIDLWWRRAWRAQQERYWQNGQRLRAKARRIEIRNVGRRRRRHA